MNTDSILYIMRARLLDNGVITGNGDFHGDNYAPTEITQGTAFWIDEKKIDGHTVKPWTNKRRILMTCIVEYDIYVPIGTGTLKLAAAADAIESAFDILDDTKSNVSSDTLTATVHQIVVKSDGYKNDIWRVRPVLVYVRCASRAPASS